MAKTNFSGPITAGKIENTTGFTPSQNVRNTGFVTMGQSYAFDSALLAVDADSIATAASNPAGQGAGALNLTNNVDGTAASGSFVMPGVGATGIVSGALGGVAGAAKQHYFLLIIGLLLSVVLIGTLASYFAKYIKDNKWLGWVGIGIILIVAMQLIVGGLDNLGVITVNESFRSLFHV